MSNLIYLSAQPLVTPSWPGIFVTKINHIWATRNIKRCWAFRRQHLDIFEIVVFVWGDNVMISVWCWYKLISIPVFTLYQPELVLVPPNYEAAPPPSLSVWQYWEARIVASGTLGHSSSWSTLNIDISSHHTGGSQPAPIFSLLLWFYIFHALRSMRGNKSCFINFLRISFSQQRGPPSPPHSQPVAQTFNLFYHLLSSLFNL